MGLAFHDTPPMRTGRQSAIVHGLTVGLHGPMEQGALAIRWTVHA
jgi:hypothetical protein